MVNFNNITSYANKCIFETEIHPQTENKLMVTKGEIVGEGDKLGGCN